MKILVELEVNPIKGLDTIACTLFDVVKTVLEDGLDNNKKICKILNITSVEGDVSLFYESGTDYKKGISYKNEKQYLKRDAT